MGDVHVTFRMLTHHGVFSLFDEITKLAFGMTLNSLCRLCCWYRHTGWKVSSSIRETSIARCAANGNEAIGARTQHLCNMPDPTISRDG